MGRNFRIRAADPPDRSLRVRSTALRSGRRNALSTPAPVTLTHRIIRASPLPARVLSV
jgi:hypothetical protein